MRTRTTLTTLGAALATALMITPAAQATPLYGAFGSTDNLLAPVANTITQVVLDGLPTGSSLPVVQSPSHPFPGAENEARKAQEVFDLTNQERIKHGREPFERADDLSEGAYTWAQRMDRTQDFSHSGGNYAENLFWFANEGDAGLIVRMWMESPGHRRNILDPTSHVLGVGVSEVGNGTYAVQRFL